jgi:hypothetical protein
MKDEHAKTAAENAMDFSAFYQTFDIDPPRPPVCYYLSSESPWAMRQRFIAEAYGAAMEMVVLAFCGGCVFGVLAGWYITKQPPTKAPTTPTATARN